MSLSEFCATRSLPLVAVPQGRLAHTRQLFQATKVFAVHRSDAEGFVPYFPNSAFVCNAQQAGNGEEVPPAHRCDPEGFQQPLCGGDVSKGISRSKLPRNCPFSFCRISACEENIGEFFGVLVWVCCATRSLPLVAVPQGRLAHTSRLFQAIAVSVIHRSDAEGFVPFVGLRKCEFGGPMFLAPKCTRTIQRLRLVFRQITVVSLVCAAYFRVVPVDYHRFTRAFRSDGNWNGHKFV